MCSPGLPTNRLTDASMNKQYLYYHAVITCRQIINVLGEVKALYMIINQTLLEIVVENGVEWIRDA